MATALSKRHITLWVVLLLVLLSLWLQRQEDQALEQPQDGDELVMDYSLTDFEITAMDEAGQPKHRLQGESMVHYAETDYAELVQPHLEVYRDDGAGPMSLDADVAMVYDGGESVLLQGEVRMLRQDALSEQIMEVQTRDVWFYSARELAETSEKVTILDARGTTTATGMKIDLKAGTMELLASVRGKYELE